MGTSRIGVDRCSLLVWDLGRPGKARIARILAHLLERRYDLLVLAKIRHSSLEMVVEALEGAGYSVLLGGLSLQPSLVVASLSSVQENSWPAPERYQHRWIPFSLQNGITGLGVHIPYSNEAGDAEGKRQYWDHVLNWSRTHQDEKAMILGVFNTGLPADSEGERYTLGSYMLELLDRGWVDCWRHANIGVKDFGWFSHTGNGFRLDHCFFSPSLAAALVNAEFDHEARLTGLSSSAPLLVLMAQYGQDPDEA